MNSKISQDPEKRSRYIIPANLRLEAGKHPGLVDISVEDFPKTNVAYTRYIGPYAGDGKLFQRLYKRLYDWAIPKGLVKEDGNTQIVIYHDSISITDENKLRVSAGIVVPHETESEGEIGIIEIPRGRYVIGKFLLKDDEYFSAWDWVYSKWFPNSGYQPADGYCFEKYEHNPSDGYSKRIEVSICVPVKKL